MKNTRTATIWRSNPAWGLSWWSFHVLPVTTRVYFNDLKTWTLSRLQSAVFTCPACTVPSKENNNQTRHQSTFPGTNTCLFPLLHRFYSSAFTRFIFFVSAVIWFVPLLPDWRKLFLPVWLHNVWRVSEIAQSVSVQDSVKSKQHMTCSTGLFTAQLFDLSVLNIQELLYFLLFFYWNHSHIYVFESFGIRYELHCAAAELVLKIKWSEGCAAVRRTARQDKTKHSKRLESFGNLCYPPQGVGGV